MSEQDKLIHLQQYQQQLQALSSQKQSIQLQEAEVSNALKELSVVKDEKVFEIVGNVLINRKPDELIKRLNDKKERISLRLESIDKQIKRITEKVQSLQKELIKKGK